MVRRCIAPVQETRSGFLSVPDHICTGLAVDFQLSQAGRNAVLDLARRPGSTIRLAEYGPVAGRLENLDEAVRQVG